MQGCYALPSLGLLLVESNAISSEYLCTTTSIAATTLNDVLTVTTPFESMLPEKVKKPPFNSQETMKYPGDSLHSFHIDFNESSISESYHTSSLQRLSTSNERSRVFFTRSTSSLEEDNKSCFTD